MNNLYKAYSVNKRKSENTPKTTTVTFEQAGTAYRVIMTKKRANRLSVIRCLNNTVVWEQIPLLCLLNNARGEGEVIDSIPVAVNKEYVTLFVIQGKPGRIEGLDEGIFRSAKTLDASCINVMSEKKFREI
ncbi:MAG: hypothetical protein IJW70_08865 [Clostridia bacterium]|nr:hypothetical protein [Clostridia bacterium]